MEWNEWEQSTETPISKPVRKKISGCPFFDLQLSCVSFIQRCPHEIAYKGIQNVRVLEYLPDKYLFRDFPRAGDVYAHGHCFDCPRERSF